MQIQDSTTAQAAATGSARLKALLYGAVLAPAILLAVCDEPARAGALVASDFQTYNAANAATITPGPFSLYEVPVDSIQPTQLSEGMAEVGKKTAGWDLLSPSELQATLLTDIEPVVIGPGGKLYLLNGHHTFTSLENSIYGASNPDVFVNVVANYSNLTTAQFFATMAAQNLLLPVSDGVVEPVDDATGAPFPTSLQDLTNDPYRGLEFSILKNKSSKLFTTANNITGAVGASTPGLDKMTGFYEDFFEADAYRGADGGRGLPYLSPGDIAIATDWNLNPNSITTLPNVAGNVTAAQLPGFILGGDITVSSVISDATLANGALDGSGGVTGNATFTGLTEINAGTTASPIIIGTPNTGFIMQLGADKGFGVNLTGNNTYTGGTSILAGTLTVADDAALGAAAPATYTIDPNNVKTSVQAANGIVFNSLDEGAGTLMIGTTPGLGTATFTTNRPIAVGGETATINLNGYVVTLGQLASLGSASIGLGNESGESDLTIDDNSSNKGVLILDTASPDFYGDIIIGGTNKPTVEVFSDAALGNTTAPAADLGEVVLNGGTFKAGASFDSVRGMSVTSKSTFDTNSFTTVFAGNLTDDQRNLTITNTGAGSGNVTFGAFDIGSALELTVSKGTGTSTTVTFEDGIQQSSVSDQLLLAGAGASGSLGTVEKVMVGAAATPPLTNGIVAPWIVIDSGASNNPYDFATYGNTTGYTAFTGYTGNLAAATSTSVVKQAAAVTLTGNTSAYALNIQKGIAVNTGGHTLTLGDGTNAGLILNGGSGSGIMTGNLSFGAAEAYVTISGSSTISSTIIGSGGLNLAGTSTLTLSSPSQETGLVTINSGTLTLSATNVFAGDGAGLYMQDTKNLATANLILNDSNQFAALNANPLASSTGNAGVTINGASILTIGDSTNQNSTFAETITDATANVAGAITKDGTGLLDLSQATVTLGAGSSIVANAGDLRVATGALKNTAVAGSAPNFVLNNGADLQFAQSGGGQYAGAISGNGTLHLIGGTLQLTGTNNTYTGGTIVEIGSTLDITTANLPSVNENITDAGGLVLFDQATTGNFTGVISDGAEMGAGPVLSGSLDKDDSSGNNTGNVILTQAQTFTGQTTIEAGTLTLGAVDTLATSSGVDLGRVGGNSTATLALAANNTIQALNSEQGDQTFVTLGSSTLTINTKTGTVADFEGNITGAGALVKAGAGEQILSGSSAYAGGTTVQAGALVLTGGLNSTGDTTVTGGILDLANHGALTSPTTTVSGGLLELDAGSTLTGAGVNVGAQGTVFANGGTAAVTTYDNAGVLDLRTGTPGNTFTLNNYVGVAGSQLQIGVNFAAKTADKLVVAGATGTTAIVVTDTAPTTPAAFNPAGIPVVISSTAMSPTAFTLAGGPVAKGLFQYDLAYSPDPRFLLVSVPDADAFRLATLPTAAQSIWEDTAGVWQDRQVDLRDQLIAGESLSGPAAQGAAPTATAPGLATGVWARAVGDWTNRNETQTYSLLNKTYAFNTGYSQDTGAVFAGIDGGKQGVLGAGDALLFGATLGYIDSTQDFKGSSTSATYTGGSLGASATYLNKNLFVDALVKVDLLNLNYNDPALSPFGVSQTSGDVTNLGVIVDAGYRFNFGPAFVEPLATLADVSSRVHSMGLAGSEVTFGDNNVFRGRFGMRAGATLIDNADMQIDGSASVSYWGRISGGASATINSGPGAPLLGIADQQVTSYGEAGVGLNLISKTTGWGGFLKGDYDFATGYADGSIKGGVRLDF